MRKILRMYTLILASIAMLITPSLFASACTSAKAESGVIRAEAETYLASSPQWNITASALYLLLNDGDDSNDPFIVSVRQASAYALGHIPGAINIGLSELADADKLALLPTDKKIVVYCYTGHTGSQATAILNMLGYDATNLKFGMTAWTHDTEVAPSRFNPETHRMDYSYELTANTTTQTYSLPTIENTTSNDETEILIAAAEAYVTSSPSWNIKAADLYLLLNDGDDSNDPFILSVRQASAYALGHIPGAVNIGLSALADADNLAKLPTDKKIVVYCYTGHTGSQATAILNLLGYDATNLKFGMTAWTEDTVVAPGAFNNATSSMTYTYATGS
jgi:sulfur-carrier protein adenylyltransferase/sulfurtransferase